MAETITSTNPATLEVNGSVEATDPKEVEAAVQAARDAQADWARRPLDRRREVLERFQDLLVERAREVAETVTRETGKPLGEAMAADLYPVADAVEFVADRGEGVLREPVPLSNPLTMGRTSEIRREPVGVAGIITPWNYPFALPGSQVVYSLFAGNGVVLKPATETPLAADLLAELLAEAGLPDDLLHVVHGSGPTVGQALADAPIDHLIFTGSGRVGWQLHDQLADRDVPTCLELGGSDPAVVLDDADLDLAADGIVWARFTNAGQTCSAIKRVLALEPVAEELTERIVEKVGKLRVGDPMDRQVDVGPLIHAEAVDDLHAQVQAAVDDGATVLTGGKPLEDREGHFYEPTVLTDVEPGMSVLAEETFGPVLPVVPVPDEDAAIEEANATEYGLTASVWTRDLDRGRRLADRIDAGTVMVNDHAYTYAINATPWAGRKQSGRSATHGRWGLEDVTQLKHVHVAKGRRNLWWFPYPDDQVDLMEEGLDFLYGDGVVAKLVQAPRMLKRMRDKEGL